VCRIDGIVWAYLERIRRRLNGIIPIGTTNQMVMWSRDGRGAVLPLRTKKDVVQALETLQQAAPWTFIGYTDVLKESWNNDREDLIALFDSRQTKNGLRITDPEAGNVTMKPIN